MNNNRAAGVVAIVLAGVIVINVVSFALLFTIGEPFGGINDVGIAIAGLLTTLLALLLRRLTQMSRALDVLATSSALVGGLVVALGSALVPVGFCQLLLRRPCHEPGEWISGLVARTGQQVAWIPLALRSEPVRARCDHRVADGHRPDRGLGVAMGIEDMDAAPAWLGVAFPGILAQGFLLPVWSIRLARSLLETKPPVNAGPGRRTSWTALVERFGR